MPEVTYKISPPVAHEALSGLFASAWKQHQGADFSSVLSRSLAYVCAYAGNRLVGFVNLAWDGGCHAFVLDTTVHRDWQRRGIGQALVKRALEVAREREVEWVHVDFEPHLRGFYAACGFRETRAGVVNLKTRAQKS